MNILDEFDRFSFAVIPCPASRVADTIKQQGVEWGGEYAIDDGCLRDVRAIYLSPDGPKTMPARNIGILLSEVNDQGRTTTLFVSSVSDGYHSMVMAISKKIPGVVMNFRVSRMDLEYPGVFIESFVAGRSQRTVYSMKDEREWVFWEKGDPLEFEEPQRYLARRKRDRLNPDIISGYLQKLGYVSLEREFWISDHEPARLLAHKDFRVWYALEPTQH